MGDVNRNDILSTVWAIEETLKGLKYRFEHERGLKRVQEKNFLM